MEQAMKVMNEKTQSARWLYDEEADVLYVSANDPKPAQIVDVESGILVAATRTQKRSRA